MDKLSYTPICRLFQSASRTTNRKPNKELIKKLNVMRGGLFKPTPQSKIYPDIGQVDYYPRRQQNIRLSLKGNAIRVSYPYFLSFRRAEKFLLARQAWILKHRPETLVFKNGMKIGTRHQLEFSQQEHLIKDNIIFAPADNETRIAQLIKEALKIEALEILLPLAEAQIQRSGLRPEKIRSRYMRSQWGSCTSKNNICLNSCLIYLPDNLINYVIIHELCHLKLLNHSPSFWRLVAKYSPEYLSLRKQLREYRINLVI